MKLPTYEAKTGQEFGWFGLGLGAGALAAALVSQFGGTEQLTVATGMFVTSGTRLLLSRLLPSPRGDA